jgi:hypothetical protein
VVGFKDLKLAVTLGQPLQFFFFMGRNYQVYALHRDKYQPPLPEGKYLVLLIPTRGNMVLIMLIPNQQHFLRPEIL